MYYVLYIVQKFTKFAWTLCYRFEAVLKKIYTKRPILSFVCEFFFVNLEHWSSMKLRRIIFFSETSTVLLTRADGTLGGPIFFGGPCNVLEIKVLVFLLSTYILKRILILGWQILPTPVRRPGSELLFAW